MNVAAGERSMRVGPFVDQSSSIQAVAQEALLYDERLLFEQRFWDGRARDTWNNLSDFDFGGFGFEDIREAIRGKVVGDVGSGLGGLAKSAVVEGIPAVVYSINPHLSRDEYKENEEYATGQLKVQYPDLSDEQLAAAQSAHDERLSTNFAYDLHDFPDGMFDLLIDHFAVSFYALDYCSRLYEASILEMLRVVRPGGSILVRDGTPSAVGQPESFKEQVLQKLGVRYESVRVGTGYKPLKGIILYKDTPQ
jgi:SAM-dependent methyltransferase